MVELEVIPSCRHYGLGLIPWSPLGGGLLGGVLGKLDEGRRVSEAMQRRVEQKQPQLERYEALCGEMGEEPATVAHALLLHQPTITAPIIGPRTLDQLESAVRATALTLDEQALEKLDAIFPGPGGEAQQAYAGSRLGAQPRYPSAAWDIPAWRSGRRAGQPRG